MAVHVMCVLPGPAASHAKRAGAGLVAAGLCRDGTGHCHIAGEQKVCTAPSVCSVLPGRRSVCPGAPAGRLVVAMSEPSAKRPKGPDAPDNLDDSEATQYDRQIRLWGLDAQKRSVA